ncbi:hypothetical protein R80B4_00082 [Fibrobacteres bacterium R8-0-B4]
MTDQELKDLVASLAESGKRVDRQLEELGLKLKDVGERLDGLGLNAGHHAEQFFQDVFKRKKEFGGIKYDDVVANFGLKDRNRKMEIDIALINGDSVALIEAKNRIHPDFVDELTEKRVEKFKTLFPEYKNYKIYLGIAGFSFDDELLIRAKKKGIGIVKQVGEGIEVDAENLKAY